ncbi:MAG: LemA family protein [Candidatus Micrarchaeota archaeon]|nr:LemA family protein [Candidatus Micrarchaeota archaeon]
MIELLVGVLGVILVVAVLYLIWVFNAFITLRSRIDNAWSQIDVQLKRRFDLIPNLVETVKGYAKHERETFDSVTKARAQMAGAKSVGDMAKANNALTSALKTLFAVAENYPELKANENFKMLQEELSGTESKIAYARQFYNDNVMGYNIKRESFPSNIIASLFNFGKRDYFEIEEAAREAVKVKF